VEQESTKKESKGSLAELVKERDQVCSSLTLAVVHRMAAYSIVRVKQGRSYYESYCS